jgi:hypothetical protein
MNIIPDWEDFAAFKNRFFAMVNDGLAEGTLIVLSVKNQLHPEFN